MIEGINGEQEREMSVENYRERNYEDNVYRNMLIKEGVLEEKGRIEKSDFSRVREIAYSQRVKSEEEARNLAMLEFSLTRKISEGEKAMDIYKEIGGELSELVSELFTDETQKNDEEVCSHLARSTLEQFVRLSLDGIPEPFMDMLFKKIEERERIVPTLPKNVAMSHESKTGRVEVIKTK